MSSLKQQVAADYERIRQRSREDPGTAGDEAEETWAALLRNWLPAGFPVVTKGRILTADGLASPQVDVLVLRPSYPLALRDKKHYFAGGVLAAFECKLTLRARDLVSAFRNCVAIKRLYGSNGETPYDQLQQPIIYGVLAHTCQKTSTRSSLKLFDWIERYEMQGCSHPREMLDILCVADTATFVLHKTLVVKGWSSGDQIEAFQKLTPVGGVATALMAHGERQSAKHPAGDIIGAFIWSLTSKFAYEHEELRPFASYLDSVGVWASIGRVTTWSKNVLTPEVWRHLQQKGFDDTPWSKWASYL